MSPLSSRIADLDDALAAVLVPGQRIVIGQSSAAPTYLMHALPRHAERLRGSSLLVGMVPPGFLRLPGTEVITFFPSGPLGTRDRLDAWPGRYLRKSLYQVSAGIRDGSIPVDVLLAQATPPRGDRCSLGLGVDFVAPAAERAGAVVLEIRRGLPWTGPRSEVAVSDGMLLVESPDPPATFLPPSASGDGRLGVNLSRWIPDGATLELGMGRWAAQLTAQLRTRRGLRLHTGLLGDWILELEASRSLDPQAPVRATAAGGSAALLRVLDDHERFRLAPAYETHSSQLMSALPAFRAINSVLEVDLAGNANSEASPDGRLGGLGGLPDFAWGASGNPDGLSILALNSVARGQSRIVPRLRGPVSLTASAVDVVVTEQGSADLRNRSAGERARALIAVAAPEHRRALNEAAQALDLC